MRLFAYTVIAAIMLGTLSHARANVVQSSAATTIAAASHFALETLPVAEPILLTQTRRYQPFRFGRRYRGRYYSRAPYTFGLPRYAPGAYYRPIYPYRRGYYGRRSFNNWSSGGVSVGPLNIWW